MENVSKGWINPPLRFHDEPCRHKVLDLIGDLSLFAQLGSQGIPLAHLVVYKVSSLVVMLCTQIFFAAYWKGFKWTSSCFPLQKCKSVLQLRSPQYFLSSFLHQLTPKCMLIEEDILSK
uniref:Uncharacterized protein n=1 Tax=Cucumis sativus TaxID=3659 RepID=A0A0A0KJH1_CUCSA